MNALESYRKEHHLTFEAIANMVGVKKPTVWRHCAGDPISGESALLYHTKLQIPLEELRPDLYPTPTSGHAQPQDAA